MDVIACKRSQLEALALHRERLRKAPHLRWLFFEITSRCNLNCRHCGSRCSGNGRSLSVAEIADTLKTLQPERPTVCLTGGEPLLHPDFFEIAECVQSHGFSWGITTNGTLIDEAAAHRLRQAGMSTVSVSLDGMEASHDALRQQRGAWRLALNGLQALQKAGFTPQVTTVLHRGNFSELEELYHLLCSLGVTAWRPINVEPIGRACESSELFLQPKQFAQLLHFIREKRFDPGCGMEICFGCSHYLGVEYERMVRDHYFLCGAGILTASVRSNGDICACLDIENRPELVQGNIHTDRFLDVWRTRFQPFRRSRASECAKCAACPERFLCDGDSAHTWSYEKNEPLLCYQDFSSALHSEALSGSVKEAE